MKQKFFKLLFSAILAAFIVSCDSDDDNDGGTTPPPVNDELNGDVTTATVLDATIAYRLTGAYVVRSGASLTIPAGTQISAEGGTAAFIGVERGAQIFINGDANNPVVMTSGSANPAPADWGGLVIAGDAPTNKGTDLVTEVGDLTYGGNNQNDNSGSIRYLRVEYTGATFSNDKEFNGVSLFGVGAGTTFEFVQSFNGGDDGIEFFGGTVDGNNLVSYGSGDDSIDFADGWAGSGNNWYIANGAKAGIEGSNNGDDGTQQPFTMATLTNISIVGPVTEGAIFFKEGGGVWNVNNVFVSNVDLGISVDSQADDPPANERIDNGDLIITNIQFADTAEGFETDNYSGMNDMWLTEGIATGAGNGAASPDWAAGWTVGLDNSGSQVVNLAGEISTAITLNANIDYRLTGALVVRAPGSLTLPAGTTIKAEGGTASFIGVERGAQIFINGDSNNPVVMTSASDNPTPGDWGGLVVAGDAPTNKGIDLVTEVGDLVYGGTNVNDNSGSIRYLRVEYTGATFSNDKEFNGVSLFGVGAGTTFEFVQSYMGGDDGIEFFGGTVDGINLVSIGSGDDSIDFADGWDGVGDGWYIAGGAKAGIEGSNNGDDGTQQPFTMATLRNITVVGPVTEGAIFFKEGGGQWTIENLFCEGVDLGISVDSVEEDPAANTRIDEGDLVITNIQFSNNAANFEETNYTGSADFYTIGANSGAGNGAAAPDWADGWTIFN
ncbi:MAG: hypothetical protein AAGH46_01350 [Bacteroidota bacterium]